MCFRCARGNQRIEETIPREFHSASSPDTMATMRKRPDSSSARRMRAEDFGHT